MSAQQEQPQQTTEFNIGDTVTFTILDEEYYSRGYGVIWETKTAKIVGIRYVMDNYDTLATDHSTLKKVNAPDTAPNGLYAIGDTLTYKTLDEEYYSRGYGVIMETKTAKIVKYKYVMDTYDQIASDHRSLKKKEIQ